MMDAGFELVHGANRNSIAIAEYTVIDTPPK